MKGDGERTSVLLWGGGILVLACTNLQTLKPHPLSMLKSLISRRVVNRRPSRCSICNLHAPTHHVHIASAVSFFSSHQLESMGVVPDSLSDTYYGLGAGWSRWCAVGRIYVYVCPRRTRTQIIHTVDG
ncbi:hypothetical protein SCHPADRAFT_498788 [Schizopora paradoxa]|uniref:Uncharacterized protein n=1 Tax=Schizopora paradoxa TaxID=27342 RepID=A0A0H2RG41_9AGAM|nr:hypothetical protein SCHPADRAFT_498788 [Schizopora paradoxa]